MSHDHLGAARLDGRGFVILGAGGGGMGTATSHALAAAGAELICVDADPAEAEAIAAATGGTAMRADVTERASMIALFAEVERRFGDRFAGVVDIVGAARNGPLPSFDDDAIDHQFAIVTRHALLATQIAAPLLAARGGGSIVFIGSLSGLSAIPNQTIYGMAKAALHQLVISAAQEFGPQGVRVNAVAPGFVRTPRLHAAIPDAVWRQIADSNPLRRVATSEDVAKAILFLLSDLSDYVTANILTLDGGVSKTTVLPGLDVPLGRQPA